MARGREVDRAMVDLVLSMKQRNEKLTTDQIAQVVQCDATTAGRIIRGGSWEGYCELKAEKARKEREKNRKAAEKKPAEEPEREPGREQAYGRILCVFYVSAIFFPPRPEFSARRP